MSDQTTTDTLPHWLYVRFGKGPMAWHELTPDDQSYWEHEAAAVRRAVARGGFKPEAAGVGVGGDPDKET
jgi:hypothetical protein